MKQLKTVLLGARMAALVAGCLFTPEKDDPVDARGSYPSDLSSPDSVLQQLNVAYVRKEIEPYAILLAPNYIFEFQEGEGTDFPDGLSFTQDSTFTNNMFTSPEVTNITLSMTPRLLNPESIYDVDETVLYDLVDLALDVDLSSDVTLRVAGQNQYYHFVEGKDGNGNDRWFIRAWIDIGDPGGTGGAPAVRPLSQRIALAAQAAGEQPEVIPVTMSELRTYFSAEQ